jgi:hypothetical protein
MSECHASESDMLPFAGAGRLVEEFLRIEESMAEQTKLQGALAKLSARERLVLARLAHPSIRRRAVPSLGPQEDDAHGAYVCSLRL